MEVEGLVEGKGEGSGSEMGLVSQDIGEGRMPSEKETVPYRNISDRQLTAASYRTSIRTPKTCIHMLKSGPVSTPNLRATLSIETLPS